ncbi:MAG: hypothetical protein AAGG44_20570, partial [Planctomycetota bacterium]
MKSLKPYIDAILAVWQDNTPAARVGLVLLASLCIVAVGGVGYWSVQPNYVVLVSGSESDKIEAVISALAKENIDYDHSQPGILKVDQRDYARARLLARSSGVATEMPGASGSMGGVFSSPTERRNLARQQRERDLEAMIKRLEMVEQAGVKLNIPERGAFERKTSKPTASVLLTLKPDLKLSELQAMSIAKLVAYAVEDLDPTAVQITDKLGNSYTTPDDETHQINNQVEYAQMQERALVNKAERQLLKFL